MLKDMKFKLFAGSIFIVVLIVAYILLNRNEAEADEQSTDDAYVRADATVVAAQLAGVIEKVNVADHQWVQAGEALVTIDQRDIDIQLKDAEAQSALKKSDLSRLKAQIAQQQSLVQRDKANLGIDQANLKLAQQDQKRFSQLAQDGSGTLQAKQQAEAQYAAQQGVALRNQAALHSTEQQVDVLKAEYEKALADVSIAEVNIESVKLKRSYANVMAPISGYIDQKQARVGGYTQIGSPLLAIVPLNAIYIEANFRETQLEKIRTGQVVDIIVDALPNIQFKGRVQSVGPASGASYSALSGHNATGNFTKIVQRLPIRIQLDPKQKDLQKLRVGMSVKPKISVN